MRVDTKKPAITITREELKVIVDFLEMCEDDCLADASYDDILEDIPRYVDKNEKFFNGSICDVIIVD